MLRDPAGLGQSPKIVLALPGAGPELLYRTPHSVLAIPHHRYQPGFAAGYRIFTATDFTEAESLLARWRVDLVVICPGAGEGASKEQALYVTEVTATTLYQALRDGAPPAFLEPVVLPAAVARGFKVFRYRPGP